MKSHHPHSWRSRAALLAAALAIILTSASHLAAQDAKASAAAEWHQWLGPNRTGVSAEKNWLTRWPEGGPKLLWKKQLGVGWSAVSVAGGRAYTMGNDGKTDTVFCLDVNTGEELWTKSYPCPKGNHPGPRSTPTVDGKVVYTLSRQGDIFCLDAASGKEIWKVNARKEYGARPPSWGFACSPLVLDEMLIVDVGVVLALNKKTGKLAGGGWKSAKYPAGYSSPVAFTRDGKTCLAVFNAFGLVVLDAGSGRELGRLRWQTRHGVNAATPVIIDGKIFISSGYGSGCALVRLGKEGMEIVWRNKQMKNQFSTSVLHRGYLYGIDGNVGGVSVKCLEVKTGEVKWSYGRMGMGSLLLADGKLIVLSDRGLLMTGVASPDAFKPLSRAKVISGKCWTAPVLSGGKVFCRSHQGDLVCLDVSGK